jgi:hypothetical protein
MALPKDMARQTRSVDHRLPTSGGEGLAKGSGVLGRTRILSKD